MKLKPRSSGILLIALLSLILLNTVFPVDLLAAFEVAPCHNWDVIVYVDEEMMGSTFVMYKPYVPFGFDLISAKQYAAYQVLRGSWQYNVQFDYTYRVVDVLEWESSDHLNTADELLDELVEQKWKKSNGRGYKTGSFYGGEPYDKKQIVLIGFTKQELTSDAAGLCWIADGCGSTVCAILISYTNTWIDDNIIMHELGHLHGLDDHPESDGCLNCVMEYAYAGFIMFYNEPLQPLYDSHAQLDISLWSGCIRGGYIHYSFCDECKSKIEENCNPGNYFGYPCGEIKKWDGNGGITDEMPKPEQPKPQLTIFIIAAWIGAFIIIIVVFRWIIKKLRRKRRD